MRLNRYSFLSLLAGALFLLPQAVSAQSLTAGAVLDSPVYSDTRGSGGIVITQSKADFIDGGGVSCANADGGYTTDNSYFRAFDLSGIDDDTDDITVTSVDLGIGGITLNGNDPVSTTVRFHEVAILNPDGSFLIGDATLIGEQEYIVSEAEANSLQNVEITENIVLPMDAIIAVEWFAPSGNPADTGLDNPWDIRYGQNNFGETGPTLLASEACGIVDPTFTGDLGDFGDLNWVLFVNGTLGAVANEDGATPQFVSLGSNFPNPVVSGTTRIPFALEAAQDVTVAVFDALGREVISTAATFAAGDQSVTIDTSALPNGVYFYRLSAGDTTQTRKMTVVQ